MVDVTPPTLDKKLQGFQLIAQEKFQSILCAIPGKKDLILEPTLIKPLERVCTASWLKLKGIQRIYKYDQSHIIARTSDQVQIYMIRSELPLFQAVLKQLQQHQPVAEPDSTFKHYHIVCVPSCFAYFQTLLEEAGLYGIVQLHRYNWDFIYLDSGVLSLECRNVYGTIFLHRDSSLLPAIAQSLRVLQMVCGRPNLIMTFGEQSAQIVKILQTLGPWRKETGETTAGEFGAILIIDRDKDYASSLLTPAIYAGLLMEVFNQRAGEITIEAESNKILNQKLAIFQQKPKLPLAAMNKPPKPAASKPTSIRMNSQADEIYGDNRYKHFSQASSWVRAQAKAIGLEVQKLNDMKLEEMHDYVARKLPKITEMKTKILRHLNASEIVIDMMARNFRRVQSLEEDILNNVSRKRLLNEIDELLTTDGQQHNTLRLLCLLHLCTGVTPDELQQFARNYCNYFGHQKLYVLQRLSMAGLLPQLPEDDKLHKSTKLLSNLPIPKFQQTEFQANANRLKLLVSSAGAESKSDVLNACPSFVFNGAYIPMIAQLCSLLLKSTNGEELASKLGMLEKLQICLSSNDYEPLGVKTYANLVKSAELSDIFPLRTRQIFVYVVGGVTYAEIGACDFISRLTGAQIIVAGDCIIAGSDIISQAN